MVFMMTKQFPAHQGAELSNPPPPLPPPSEPPSDCPRCGSTNTKFCYYNNYNKSQPRHFCKSCKRHWTKGGTLRNIPAGRRRKNTRPRPSTTAAKPEQQQKHFHNSLSLSTDHKSMSNILYQALIHSSSPSTTDCFNINIPQSTILESNGTINYTNPNTEFITFSNFTSTNYQSCNDDYVVNCADNLDSTEESTATTSAPPPLPAINQSTAAVDVADM